MNLCTDGMKWQNEWIEMFERQNSNVSHWMDRFYFIYKSVQRYAGIVTAKHTYQMRLANVYMLPWTTIQPQTNSNRPPKKKNGRMAIITPTTTATMTTNVSKKQQLTDPNRLNIECTSLSIWYIVFRTGTYRTRYVFIYLNRCSVADLTLEFDV